MRNILIIQGNPDPAGAHYSHALARAYRDAAQAAGHLVQEVDVATLDFPLLRSKEDFEKGKPADSILEAQELIVWAEHIVIFFPLWLGSMPALLKGFLEQVFRPGFAAVEGAKGMPWKKRLSGKTARIVVTMGMPALLYRWYFRAHSLKSLERNILGFCGIRTTGESLIGLVESGGDAYRRRWVDKMTTLGAKGG